MSETRYAGYLSWAATRRAAPVLRAARMASGKRQADVAAELGWSVNKLYMAELAVIRMTPAGALMFAEAVGLDPSDLGLEAA